MKKILNLISKLVKKKPTTKDKKICPNIVKECFSYLEGRECSDEIKKRIEHYLSIDPNLSKLQAVEELLDLEERKLKNK